MRSLKTFITRNWILFVSILVFLAIRLLWLETTISRDEGAFGFVGLMWMRGVLPTYWLDTQGPLTYAIYASILYFFGNSIIPIRLMNNLLFIGSYVIIYLIASKLFGKRIGLISVLFYGFSMNVPILEAMTALTEPVSIPFTVLSIYLCIRYTEHNYWLNLIGSGLLMSAATLIRATNGVGFLLLFFILMRKRNSPTKQHSTRLASLLLISGASIPFLAVLTYFGVQNELYGLMQLYFRAGTYLSSFQDVPFYIKYLIAVENLPIWIFSVVGVLIAIKKRTRNYTNLLFWAFLFVSVSLIPPTFGHRIILLLPAVCILAGLGLDFTAIWIGQFFHHNHSVEKRKFKFGYLIVCSLMALMVIPSVFYQSKQYPQMNLSQGDMQWAYADTDYSTQIEVSKYLLLHTSSGGKIFVHAWAAEIYWLAEKAPPSKYVWSLLYLPEDEENRLANLTKNTAFDYIVVFSPSYTDLFKRAESSDPIVRHFLNYYSFDKKIKNAYIFSKYDNSNSSVVYSFIEEFEESDKYYDLANGKFGKAEELANDIFMPKKWIVQINEDIRYAIEQTPHDQPQEDEIVKSYVSYNVHIPSGASLKFGIALDPSFWDKAHETRFQIQVKNDAGIYVIFDDMINPKNEPYSQWKDHTLPLSKFANQDVEIVFIVSTGPERLNVYSFAIWGNPVIITNE